MFLKYALYAFQTTDAFTKWYTNDDYTVIFSMYKSLYYMLGPIYHWTYASQYLKTCLLTRGILKKAILLFQRNKTVIDEHDLNSKWFEFVQKNETIDVTLN